MDAATCTTLRLHRGSAPRLPRDIDGRYTIHELIGQGGFSSVYRGVHLASGRDVALKLPTTTDPPDREAVVRLRREAVILGALRDVHTVIAYDGGITREGMPYLVLEYLRGTTLRRTLVHEQRLPWRRVVRILRAICSSLAEAHALGIVHRDLKPENVFLERCLYGGELVKVLDFGIAKPIRRADVCASEEVTELTAVGVACGTPDYMSPEQRSGAPVDGRSDLFALGVLGYELLTGRVPPLPVDPPTAVPPLLYALIAACLAAEPQARPRTASAAMASLDALIHHRSRARRVRLQ
jgi:serine/threonine protein kinase